MARFHEIVDLSTDPATVSLVPFTADEETAADAAEAAAAGAPPALPEPPAETQAELVAIISDSITKLRALGVNI